MLIPVSKELLFQGRSGDPRLGEWVETPSAFPKKEDKRHLIILYGCPDDTGVLANKGRAGAKSGPDSIRKHLYKMTLPMDLEIEKSVRLVDLGNIRIGSTLLETHSNAELIAQKISNSGATLIALGGGHDFAAPNFIGWAKGLPSKSKKGLINIDPHLDLRPLDQGANSGTPFRQILESKLLSGNNFIEFGIRANRNARDPYKYALKNGVRIITLEDLREKGVEVSKDFLKLKNVLSKKVQAIAVTIDMDSCTDGEGTSAAPVLGFTAQELGSIASIAGKDKKISYFEIAEVAPPLDPSERTSRIAAELVYAFVFQRGKSLSASR